MEPTIKEISAAHPSKGTTKATTIVAADVINPHVAAALALKGIFKRKHASAASEGLLSPRISALDGRIQPNDYLHKIICKVAHMVSSASSLPIGIDSRLEIDTHANMVVLGKNCFIFYTVHGRTCDVEPFNQSLGVGLKVFQLLMQLWRMIAPLNMRLTF